MFIVSHLHKSVFIGGDTNPRGPLATERATPGKLESRPEWLEWAAQHFKRDHSAPDNAKGKRKKIHIHIFSQTRWLEINSSSSHWPVISVYTLARSTSCVSAAAQTVVPLGVTAEGGGATENRE